MPDRLDHPANLLDQFSEALRTNRQTPPPASLDNGITNTARAIEQAAREANPDSSAMERVWQAIDSSDVHPDQQREWAQPPRVTTPNGHLRRLTEVEDVPAIPTPIRDSVAPTLARPRRRTRAVIQMVAELVLLIAGAGLLVLLFRGNGDQTGSPGDVPGTLTVDGQDNLRVITDWRISGVTLDGSVLGGIEMAGDGTMYLADVANSRILHLRADGSLISTFGSPGSGDGELMLSPGILVPALGVDSTGNIYVPDYGNSRLQVFTSDGSYVTTWDASGGLLGLPTAVAVDADDNVYVADYSLSENQVRILKIDRDGNHLLTIDTDERGEDWFGHIAGIAVDRDGNLYVCESGTNRILKFDSQGTFLLEWGGSGSSPGLFNDPNSIAVDRAGIVYVTDSFNFRVQRFDANGRYLGEWSNSVGENSRLDRPFSVATGRDGVIYVVDHGNNLHRFRLVSP